MNSVLNTKNLKTQQTNSIELQILQTLKDKSISRQLLNMCEFNVDEHFE